jgi:hypothetical protein
LVHDFYRRFIRADRSERHYVNAGRWMTVFLYVFAALLSFTLSTAQQAFQILLSIGAGTGLIYVARWFWWRVSAWSEITAMAMSLITSLVVPWLLPSAGFATVTLIQVALTTVSWILVARFGPKTDPRVLIEFYRKVRPAGPGWETVRILAGEPKTGGMGSAPWMAWGSGCLMIWASLFTLGNFLYAAGDPTRLNAGWVSLGVWVVSGFVLIRAFKASTREAS